MNVKENISEEDYGHDVVQGGRIRKDIEERFWEKQRVK
jgi:hypothetical protein